MANQEIPLSGGDNITNVVDGQWGVAADIPVDASVTEVFSSFIDSSIVSVAGGVSVDVNATEIFSSFIDSSSLAVAIDVSVSVTEVFSSFIDISAIKLPTSWTDKQPVSTTWTDKV